MKWDFLPTLKGNVKMHNFRTKSEMCKGSIPVHFVITEGVIMEKDENQKPNLTCIILIYQCITSLFISLKIEVPVPCQENEQSCICARDIYFVCFYFFLFDVEIIPTVWYFWFFILLHVHLE